MWWCMWKHFVSCQTPSKQRWRRCHRALPWSVHHGQIPQWLSIGNHSVLAGCKGLWEEPRALSEEYLHPVCGCSRILHPGRNDNGQAHLSVTGYSTLWMSRWHHCVLESSEQLCCCYIPFRILASCTRSRTALLLAAATVCESSCLQSFGCYLGGVPAERQWCMVLPVSGSHRDCQERPRSVGKIYCVQIAI